MELQVGMSLQKVQFCGRKLTRMANSTVQVSKHPNFKKLDFEGSVHATADSDFTAKSLAEGLKPNTLYYYRFKVGSPK